MTNQELLKKYAGERKELKIAIVENGKYKKIFKNRYQAAKYILENGLTQYTHERGKGFVTAAIAGSLTHSLKRNLTTIYGYEWKLISPNDHSTQITEKVKREPNKRRQLKNPHWIMIGRGKIDKFVSLVEISKQFGISYHTLMKHKKIDDYSIIKYPTYVTEKEFPSIRSASKFLRTDKDTIKHCMKNNISIHNYIVKLK